MTFMPDYSSIALKMQENRILAIPVDNMGKPATTWSNLSCRTNSRAKIMGRFGADHFGLAILTGEPSDNLEVIEIDDKAYGSDLSIKVMTQFKSCPALRGILWGMVQTPYGFQILYRCAKAGHNQRLANLGAETVIQLKGTGSFSITTPTPGFVGVQIQEIPVITDTQRAMILSILRAWDKPDFTILLKSIK